METKIHMICTYIPCLREVLIFQLYRVIILHFLTLAPEKDCECVYHISQNFLKIQLRDFLIKALSILKLKLC